MKALILLFPEELVGLAKDVWERQYFDKALAATARMVGDQASHSLVTITDGRSKPRIQVLLTSNELVLFDFESGAQLGRYDYSYPTLLPKISEFLISLADGELPCCQCDVWFKASKLKQSGFAGRICAKCAKKTGTVSINTKGD